MGVGSALIVALVAIMLQAQGMWSLGRSLTELSAADREAMTRARSEVLDNMKPGAASSWKDEKTGHLGETHLLRVYEMNGMTCGEVEHILKIPEMKRYVTSFCRTSDGTWRAIF
jgi:surface antigen